VLSNIELSAL